MMQFRHIQGAFTSDDHEEPRSSDTTPNQEKNMLYRMQPKVTPKIGLGKFLLRNNVAPTCESRAVKVRPCKPDLWPYRTNRQATVRSGRGPTS